MKGKIKAADNDDDIHKLAVIAKELHIKLEDSQRKKIVHALESLLSTTSKYYSYTPGDDDWVVRTVPNGGYIKLQNLLKFYM